jgi:hypothetical protein
MSRVRRGRWSILNAERLRDTEPEAFELVRETVGYRLCGVSDVAIIQGRVHIDHGGKRPSIAKLKTILTGYGQTLRMAGHHEYGKWFPFGGGCGDYLFELFQFPDWLPRCGLLTYGYADDPRVISHDQLRENVLRFESDHNAWLRQRERDERRVREADEMMSAR